MTDDDDNVTKLPVKFRNPPDENRTLFEPWEVGKSSCHHDAFVVDPKKSEVECAKCGESLNPMWVLSYLAMKDRNIASNFDRAQEAMTRLAQRVRTKCQHCGKLTRILGV
jgi:hypothetical protein